MLKAFSFSETNPNDIPMNTRIWLKEKEIMTDQVEKTLATGRDSDPDNFSCPVCDGCGTVIFRKYGVDYYRCSNCFSIYQPVTDKEMEYYDSLTELARYRDTAEYQSTASKDRTGQWMELIEWLKFRTYRYLGKNSDLTVIDYDNYFDGFRNEIERSGICAEYYEGHMRGSDSEETDLRADLALFMACIQQSRDPVRDLRRVSSALCKDGLIFLSSRIGTGFDVLTLREKAERIFPYSHILLPSLKGLEQVLAEAGFKILETITPGNYDFSRVLANKDLIRKDDYFLQYMFDEASGVNLEEFQRFLQKNRLSSYAQIIAQKK